MLKRIDRKRGEPNMEHAEVLKKVVKELSRFLDRISELRSGFEFYLENLGLSHLELVLKGLLVQGNFEKISGRMINYVKRDNFEENGDFLNGMLGRLTQLTKNFD